MDPDGYRWTRFAFLLIFWICSATLYLFIFALVSQKPRDTAEATSQPCHLCFALLQLHSHLHRTASYPHLFLHWLRSLANKPVLFLLGRLQLRSLCWWVIPDGVRIDRTILSHLSRAIHPSLVTCLALPADPLLLLLPIDVLQRGDCRLSVRADLHL